VVLQDAAAAFEAAVAAAGRQARPRDEAPADGAVWDEATGEPPRPRPVILPDPPAAPAEPGETAGPAGTTGTGWPAGAADPSADPPAGPSAGPAGTGPSVPPGPGEENPTQG
jgi:hypothetical protein